MGVVTNLSRRGFMASSGGLLLGVAVAPKMTLAEAATAEIATDGSVLEPNVFVSIARDGAVTIIAHRSEMGQGVRTGLPQVLADEMEADWSRVTVEQADGDSKYGSQNTDGSRSVRRFYQPMRTAGATVRQLLEQAAAKQWGVKEKECRAHKHRVVHKSSGRSLGYGELVDIAAGMPLPEEKTLRYKDASEFRYIGDDLAIVDLDDMTSGRAEYGLDMELPEMLHASIERPPVLFSRVKRFDDSGARKVTGVVDVIEMPALERPAGFKPLGGVAVLADNTWAAQKGRKQLEIDWTPNDANSDYTSAEFKQRLADTVHKPGKVVRSHGDIESAFGEAEQVVEADYYVPHLAQAPMEPPNATARFTGDGCCEIWAPTQHPQACIDTVAKVLGIKKKNVTVHVTLLGGGFGRKSKPDYVVEAAWLAQRTGKPVKVTWTREDDINHGYYHTVSMQYLKAGLDGDGKVTAWLQRTAQPSIKSTFDGKSTHATEFELGMGFVSLPYDIPNLHMENGAAEAYVRIGWLRSVANIYHAFAICSFADELAHAGGTDPLSFLRRVIGPARHVDLTEDGVKPWNYGDPVDKYPIDTGRLRGALDTVAERGDWGRSVPDGHGLGIAVHRSFLSYIGVVAEAAVADNGSITVPRLDIAIDCGRIVNPDRVRSQMEGAVIYAMSCGLTGEITFKDGRAQQHNFDTYKVPRIDSTPDTRVHLIDSDEPPAGVGEPGVPPVMPAIANAVFRATGKRLRELPLDLNRA